MGIFNILFRNSGARARTLNPAQQTTPEGYRGALTHDSTLCTGCGTCAYVCSPGAIKVDRQPDGILWQYQAVACTFCARCAEYCPTGAISLAKTAPQTAVAEMGSLNTTHRVDDQPCERCGQPFIPLPAPVLARLSGGASTNSGEGDMAHLMRLCEKCRSRVTSQRLKDSLTGVRKTGAR